MRCFSTILYAIGLAGCTGVTNSDSAPVTTSSLVAPGSLVAIPAGPFEMGCDATVHPECTGDEAPVHTISLSPYWIEATEVTTLQWRACFEAHVCPALDGEPTADDAPVGFVPRQGADTYCEWLGRRLPTEAEWERAARGSNGGLYPWGNDTPDCDRAASRACDGGVTVVATHPTGVSPEGAYDMAGNAWEWVSDGYVADFYADSPTQDPVVPSGGAGLSSVRGVDGWSDVTMLRSTNREMVIPDAVSPLVGFRCVSESAQ
jgi:formylglycine-generating enzyme required for sulfatase activity